MKDGKEETQSQLEMNLFVDQVNQGQDKWFFFRRRFWKQWWERVETGKLCFPPSALTFAPCKHHVTNNYKNQSAIFPLFKFAPCNCKHHVSTPHIFYVCILIIPSSILDICTIFTSIMCQIFKEKITRLYFLYFNPFPLQHVYKHHLPINHL